MDLNATLDQLERAARAATPGEWKLHWCDEHFQGSARGYIYSDIQATCHFYHGNKPDALFIAACNPAAILSLVAQVRQLSSDIAQALGCVPSQEAILAAIRGLINQRHQAIKAVSQQAHARGEAEADRDRERQRADAAEAEVTRLRVELEGKR